MHHGWRARGFHLRTSATLLISPGSGTSASTFCLIGTRVLLGGRSALLEDHRLEKVLIGGSIQNISSCSKKGAQRREQLLQSYWGNRSFLSGLALCPTSDGCPVPAPTVAVPAYVYLRRRRARGS